MWTKVEQLWALAVAHPYDLTQYFVGIVVPLVIVVLLFNWRVRQSMAKHKKFRRQREKLLKKLHAGREEADELTLYASPAESKKNL